MTGLVRALLVATIVLAPALALAHPNDQAYLELVGRGDALTATLDLAVPQAVQLAQLPASQDLTARGLSSAAPAIFAATLGSGPLGVEGEPCRWGAPQVVADGMRLRIAAAARCASPAGALRWTLPFVEQTPPTFRILGRADLDGVRSEFTAGPGREAIALEGPPPSGALQLARGLWRWSSAVGLLALAALLAASLSARRFQTVGALAAAVALGAIAAVLGVRIAPVPLGIAAALAGAGPSIEALRRTPDATRWRTAVPCGLVLGLALGPHLRGPLQLAGGAVGLAVAWGLAYGAGRLVRGPRRIRGAAMATLALAVVAALLQLR